MKTNHEIIEEIHYNSLERRNKMEKDEVCIYCGTLIQEDESICSCCGTRNK